MTSFLLALVFTTHFPTVGAPRPDALLVSPADANIVYEVAHGELYRSTDGGATFAARSEVYSYLAVDPVDPNLLYDTAQGFVRRSEDGGATWTTHSDGFPSFTPTPRQLVVTPKRTLFVASTCYRDHTGGGVFRSDDRAQSWSGNLVPPGLCVGGMGVDPLTEKVYPFYQYEIIPSTGTFPGAIAGSPRNPDVRYAVGLVVHGINDSEAAVLISTDEGKSWQRAAADGTPRDLALDEESGRVFLITTTGLFVSDDRTASWQRVAGAPDDARRIIIAPPFLYLRAAAGSYRAPLTNLGSFMPLGSLPGDAPKVVGLAVDPNRSGTLYAVGPAAWRSSDSGARWEAIGGDGKTTLLQPAVDGAGDLYALGSAPGVRALWHYAAATGSWETLPLEFGIVFRLVASPLRRGVLYAAGVSGLFVSYDGGHGWHQVPEIAASDLAVDPMRADVVYAGGTAGLFVSTDGGTSWRRLDALRTNRVVVAPSRPSTLYRTAPDPLWPYNAPNFQRSDDGGNTWRTLRNAPYDRAIAVDPLDEDSVWLDALLHSTDGGKTWSSELGGLSEKAIAGYVIDRDGTHIHVYLDPTYATGEFDAVLRVVRRRAARK